MTTNELRAKFEAWYVENVFDYPSNPIGSRECGLQWKVWQAAHASRDAEVEALRKDAERYRWLRNNSLGQWEHPIVVSQTKREMGMLYVGPLIGIELDKDIDAAMQEGE